MEKILAITLIIIAAAAFFAVGYNVGGNDVQVINVPGQDVEVIVNQTVEVPTADTSLLLDQAVSDFLTEVDNDKNLRKCDDDKYRLSEISTDQVDEDYSILIEDKDYTVDFEIELRYKESDLRSCYETYEVEAYYEDTEDVEIDAILA